MKIQILDRGKKKKIVSELETFGIKKVEHLLIRSGNEKVKAYSGSLSTDEIYALWRLLPIEGIGLYFAKEIIDKRNGKREIKLTIDGAHLLSDQINNKILELDENEEKQWFLGKDVELQNDKKSDFDLEKSFVIVKSSSSKDIIGTGKVGIENKILYNYLPKERRRKK